MQNWKTRHTVIDGQRLYFDGTGAQLFGNWIKWFLLTIITLGIYSFWLKIKTEQWITNTQLFSKSNLVHCLLTVDFKTLFSSPKITS